MSEVALSAGSTAGPYRIMEPLGRGGMASVYRAYEPALDRYVALKVLPREFLHDPSFAERFRREAKAIASLEHPNIVPIYAYDIEQAEGIPWMAMRLINGGSLSQLLKRERMPRSRAVAILRGVADALDHAHRKRIVHRDVKPQNVLLDEDGRVYLADFGIARMLEAKDGLTATGMITGTPQYMAPEQAMGKKVGPAADVYALGIVAYEMFAGHVPFSADTPVAILMKVVQEPLPLPPADAVPEPLLRAILKCTAKTPEDRWASAGAFVTALEAGLEARADAPTVAMPVAASTAPAAEATVVPLALRPSPPLPRARPASPAPAPADREPTRRGGLRPILLLGLGAASVALLVGATAVAWLLLRGGREPVPAPAPAGTLASAETPAASPAAALPPRGASASAPPRSAAPGATPTPRAPAPAVREPTPEPAARATATPDSAPATRAPEPTPAPTPVVQPEPAVPIPPAANPDVERLAAAVGEGEAGSRWRAAQALGAMGPAAGQAVPSLMAALGDRSAEVRWRAAEALGLIGPPARSAVPSLARALGDADPLVCAEAAKALGRMGEAAAPAVPQLAEGLRAKDTPCRREAAKALARTGRAAGPALGPLISALGDKDRFVRAQVARALGMIGPPAREAVPALTALSRDSDLVVSREAQAALRSIAGN